MSECKCQDIKNGVAILMHLPKGQTSELEPLQSIRMLHAKSVRIAKYRLLERLSFEKPFPSLLNRTIPKQISEVFSVSAK